jgi:hypothetical protein
MLFMGRWYRCAPIRLASFLLAAGVTAALHCGCLALLFPDQRWWTPSAVIATDRYQLFPTPGIAAQASLCAVPLGGQPPYTFRWWVDDPTGASADDLLDCTAGPAVRFQAGRWDGPYHVHCTVTDARGGEYTASVVPRVGRSLGLDVATERHGVLAGGGPHGETTIHLSLHSGVPPFDATWTCTGPDGKIDDDRLDTEDPLAPRFTSGNRVGTYVLTGTIVDADDDSFVQSMIIVVGQALGLDVVAGRASVQPGGGSDGMVELLATAIGGSEPFQYNWEVIGPDGASRNDLLWDRDVRSVIFESDEGSGTYLARCAATDQDGTVLIGSATIVVGQQIGIDVVADRLAFPQPGAGDGQALLNAAIRGGREPIHIHWEVVGPDGRDDTALLTSNDAQQTVFTPGEQGGSYVVRCTATDADLVPAADSLVLTVGGVLGAAAFAERTALAAGGDTPFGVTTLGVQAYGGVPPYTYAWSVFNPAGEQEPRSLDHSNDPAPTFTSSSGIGQYFVLCQVTDATGMTAADLVTLSVGLPLNVDVSVDKQELVTGGGVGGQARLITNVIGGSSPHTFSWSVTNPSGAAEPERLSDTRIADPVFTSTSVLGTYRLTLTTADALGAAFVDSVDVVVASPGGTDLGQGLSADISIDRWPVPPFGETATLTATTTGGVTPISYAWTVTDPAGGTDSARLDSTSAATVVFTSGATLGTYRVRCTVTDVVGYQFTDSAQLSVSDSFGLDVAAAVAQIVPGGTVNLFADRIGGAPSFTYTWACVDEGGAPAGIFTNGSTSLGAAVQAATDDVTNAWTAPPAGAGSSGTYRLHAVLTDTLGNTAIDSAQIVVQAPLSLNLTASNTFVLPSAVVVLLADQSGGEPPYSYTWSATDSAGDNAGTFTTGAGALGTATQNGEPGDVVNGWSSSTEGAYTVTGTVTDNAGQVFTDSAALVVTAQQPFTLNVIADQIILAPGETVNLIGDQMGGTPLFDYAWEALDGLGAPAGTLGATSQSGVADDTTNTWTAPSGADVEGTYHIGCTITDGLGRRITDTVSVVIGLRVMQNTFLAPITADTTSVLAATNLTSAATNSDPGMQITAGLSNPAHPRNVVITFNDPDNSITGGTARVTGLDARGELRAEIITLVASSGGSSTNTGAVAFAVVTQIDLYDLNGVTLFPPPVDTVRVGVGEKFGLTGTLGSAADVLYVSEDGEVIISGYSVDATSGQQGITFATPPNGTRDYVVVFRTR